MRRIFEILRQDLTWWLILAVTTAAVFSLMCGLTCSSGRADEVKPPPEPKKRITIVRADLSVLPEPVQRAAAQNAVVTTVGSQLALANGMVIRSGLVLTVAHVITAQTYRKISVVCSGKKVEAQLRALAQLDDLALLSAPECPGNPAVFALKMPDVNDELTICGYLISDDGLTLTRFCQGTSVVPDGRPRLLAGRDANFLHEMVAMHWKTLPGSLAIAGIMPPGTSASAVLDEQGRIVGILSFIDPHHGRMQIVPAAKIVRLLLQQKTR